MEDPRLRILSHGAEFLVVTFLVLLGSSCTKPAPGSSENSPAPIVVTADLDNLLAGANRLAPEFAEEPECKGLSMYLFVKFPDGSYSRIDKAMSGPYWQVEYYQVGDQWRGWFAPVHIEGRIGRDFSTAKELCTAIKQGGRGGRVY